MISSTLSAVVVSAYTSAPFETANLTAICPNPPIPATATLSPFLIFAFTIGEYVVIPAHKRGAAFSKLILSGR